MLINHRFSTRTHTEDAKASATEGETEIVVLAFVRFQWFIEVAQSVLHTAKKMYREHYRRFGRITLSIYSIYTAPPTNWTQGNERMEEGRRERPTKRASNACKEHASGENSNRNSNVFIFLVHFFSSFPFVSFLRFCFCLFCPSLSAIKSLQTETIWRNGDANTKWSQNMLDWSVRALQ